MHGQLARTIKLVLVMQGRGNLKLSELAALAGINDQTLRRDLAALVRQNVVCPGVSHETFSLNNSFQVPIVSSRNHLPPAA